MSFYDIWQQLDWTGLQQAITESTPADVERALHRERRDLTDFAALISVAAESFLPQ
jgi:2-iminoacetate synthase